MLPREEFAARCLFPALGRVRELDLFDFGVFGEETFNGRRLHAWAARAPAPRAVERDARDRGPKEPGAGWGEGRERGRTEEKEGQRAKTQLEKRADGIPIPQTLWQPSEERRSFSAPSRLPAAPTGRVCQGLPHATSFFLFAHCSPKPPKGDTVGVPVLIFFLPRRAPRKIAPRRGLAAEPGPSRRP